jgi:hypothetical protein
MVALSINDKPLLEASVSPMLKLVYRTYSDEQIHHDTKDLSIQIVDTFSEHLQKDVFLLKLKEVQQEITRTRSERKLREKLLVGTVEGQAALAKKRMRKSLKNKHKHQQQVHMRKLLK